MNKNKLYWILQLSGFTLYSLINLFFIAVYNTVYLKHIIFFCLIVPFFIITTHLYRHFIIKWGWLRLVLSKLIPKILLAVLVLSLINVLFQYPIIFFLNLQGEDTLSINYFLLNITSVMIVYLVWSILYFMYHYVDSYNTSLKYEAFKNEIELNKLKSQLNPHFIFNALNSIRALVDEDPHKSKLAITQLSNILRNSLIMDKKRLTEFSEEINTVKDYLHLETIRFEERLQTEFNIAPGSEKFKVPPLMVQTLVENGIKHGISTLKDGGLISINTEVHQDHMIIQIRNHGKYVEGLNGNGKEGYGISNTIQRLRLLFGNRATFHISNENNNIVLTELKIPKHV